MLLSDDIVLSPPGHLKQCPLIAQTARVVRKVANRDGGTEFVEFGNVLADVVVETERPALSKQDDRAAGELLGDRCDVEDGGRRDRDAILELSAPVAGGVDDFTLVHDCDGAARSVGEIEPR